MRIGLFVDGRSEFDALPNLFQRARSPHQLVVTVHVGFHPESTPQRIAEDIVANSEVLFHRRVDMLVVLLDLERRPDCPGERAASIRDEIVNRLPLPAPAVEVVVKVTRLENWLVADPACLRLMRGLFPHSARLESGLRPGTADHDDGLALLQRASPSGRSYDKRHGAVEICKRMDPGRAAQNSRSFRRFLRVLGDSRYQDQSRQPHASG